MSPHISRPAQEAERRRQELADLLTGVFDRTFAAEGPAGGVSLLRDTIRKLPANALTELIYAVGAEVEPVKEEDPRAPPGA